MVATLAGLPPGITLGGVRQDGQRHAHRAYRTAVHVGNAVLYRAVIGQVARFEVIQAVNQDVRALGVTLDVGVVQVIDNGGHFHLGIAAGDLALGGLGLGNRIGHILLIEQHLALQVGELDKIAVDNLQVPHPGPRQHVGGHRAQRAATHDQGRGIKQLLLAGLAEAGQQHLAVITRKVVAHGVIILLRTQADRGRAGV